MKSEIIYNKDEKEKLINDAETYRTKNGKIKIQGDDLSSLNIYAYGVGHVLNDLTATCWFSFLLYYLTDIIRIEKSKAGWVMLSGQVFDGIATPLVGIFSDKYKTKCGKRTPWYIWGTVCVIICFSLIFQKCTICESSSNPELFEMIYYIILPSLFNIGWAAVQVSHMALLPSISINKKNRDYMVRLRTAFTFSSQMLCLLFSFIIFYYIEDKFVQYSVLSLLCVLIGTITSAIFLFFCREVELNKNINKYYEKMKEALDKFHNISNDSENNLNGNNYNTIDNNEQIQLNQTPATYGVIYWLKKPTFYKYIVIYMLVRLSINVTSAMLPYYLESVLGIEKTAKGGTPVQISLIYLFSTAGCLYNSLFLQKHLERYNSRVVLMFSAWLFTLFGCFPIIFLHKEFTFPIFVLGFIFGIGFALALSTASSLINDVVGSKGDHGAFVYGAYSLTDKMCCGILLFFFVGYVKDDVILLKYIIPILPCVSIFFSLLIVNHRKKKKEDTCIALDDVATAKIENSKSLIDSSKLSFITTH